MVLALFCQMNAFCLSMYLPVFHMMMKLINDANNLVLALYRFVVLMVSNSLDYMLSANVDLM